MNGRECCELVTGHHIRFIITLITAAQLWHSLPLTTSAG